MELSLHTRSEGGVTTVLVGGEIDMCTEAQLRGHLLRCLEDGGQRLVVDLTDVTFLDCAGLSVLVTVHNRAHAAGGWLRLANPPRQVRRLIGIAGLDSILNGTHAGDGRPVPDRRSDPPDGQRTNRLRGPSRPLSSGRSRPAMD
jgi:anti-sigma B factor antagonist